MHYKKRILAYATLVVLSLTTVTACSKSNTETPSTTSVPQAKDSSSSDESTTNTVDYTNVIKGNEIMASYDESDVNSKWEDTSYETIIFDDTTITSEQQAITISGQTATITAAGTYRLTGNSTNNALVIDAGKEDIVWLVLDGVTMTNETTAPIYVKNAKKVIITLADGSTNTISDATTYSYADSSTTDPEAAIFSHDDLTFNGTGSLTITGKYKDAIACKDELRFVDGTYTVTAADDGIRGKDAVYIKNGTFSITSTADAIKANNDTENEKGYIIIEDGTFTITSGNDAIQAETSMWIKNGNFTIVTNGGSANAGSNTSSETEGTSDSYKALKAGCDLYITGGAFQIDSADDALHTNHTVTIDAGTFQISTGDDGIHADATLTINDGDIEVIKSYEGLEGNDIIINGGNIRLTSSDDGLNAAGGFGKDQFSSSGNHSLTINGGFLVVNADGDGLDSNGAISQTGGTVIVNGPTNGGNGALDYDSTYNITGGMLLAAGSQQMAQTTSDTSTQSSVYIAFSDTKAAGTLLTLTDSTGTAIFSFAPSKNYDSIVISTPEITSGNTYTLYLDGSNSGTATDGFIAGGSYSAGTKVLDISVSSILTQLTDQGEAASATGHMGGGKGGGGRGEKPSDGTRPDGMKKPDYSGNQTPPSGAPDNIQAPDEQATSQPQA